MKKNIFLFFILFSCLKLVNAQTQCLGGRYATDVFTNNTVASDIIYGSNINYSGGFQSLTMDIYQPAGDTLTERPVVVWVHAGSFVGGTKTDPDMVKLCQSFSKKGFVCASISYRLGISPLDSIGAMKALIRAVQDLKAAVRFFYKDRLTINTYKVDTNQIFVGGSSAGAITALHMAYLDKTCEINDFINQTDLSLMGGLDGYSGNECYSSKVKGVINLCGALGRYSWIEQGNIPLCSMHGTADNTVKYGRGQAVVLTFPVVYMDGSRMLYEQTQITGVPHRFYSWYGKTHVPYVSSNAHMDTTINFVRDFLISTMGCNQPPLINPNLPLGTATLYPVNPCSTNIIMNCSSTGMSENDQGNNFSLYPNPTSDKLFISFNDFKSDGKVEILDISGKRIYTQIINGKAIEINTKQFDSGIYFLKIYRDNISVNKKILIE